MRVVRVQEALFTLLIVGWLVRADLPTSWPDGMPLSHIDLAGQGICGTFNFMAHVMVPMRRGVPPTKLFVHVDRSTQQRVC